MFWVLGWWNSVVLLYNSTTFISNYLSFVSGWTLVLFFVVIIWKRDRLHIGSFSLGIIATLLFQAWIAALIFGVIDKATSVAISPARISGSLKDSYPDFAKKVKNKDADWWKKYGADSSTALVMVDHQYVQDRIKEYLFPHLMDGTGQLLHTISDWWDLMVDQCDSNKDGKLSLRDMERCSFEQIRRPKSADKLADTFTAFMSNQDNVENLWKYILEQQKLDNVRHQRSEL